MAEPGKAHQPGHTSGWSLGDGGAHLTIRPLNTSLKKTLARLPEKSLNRWSKNKLLPVQTRPQSPYEKFVRFQDRTFGESTQPAINAISEQAHFDLKKGEFSAEAVNGSKEFDDLKRIWAREFPWNAGKYTGHF